MTWTTKTIANRGACSTPLLDLATNIVRQTASITAYLETKQLTEPTFEPDSSDIPETAEYLALHRSLTSSLDELQHLVDGPRRTLRSLLCGGNDLAAFQVAFDFEFFTIVPPDDEISLEELASKAGVDVDRAGRCLRMMATHHVFQEKRPNWFSHTAMSLVMRNDEDLRCAGHYMLDEMWKAATATSDCIKASRESSASITPFTVRFGVPMFTYYAQNPQYGVRFAKAMAGATQVDRQITELFDEFPWEQLSGTVVDVGGGSGHVSMALAKAFPQLKFVVQDGSQDMLGQGRRILENEMEIAGRITFMQHNFLEPQPQRDVAAFFIRQCTHNWCDEDVITIFKGFVPGLEGSAPGTPLLINDTILPEPGTLPAHEERGLRQMDMLMMVGLGAKQRTRQEFERLLKAADPRYRVRHVHAEGSMGLLEVDLSQEGPVNGY